MKQLARLSRRPIENIRRLTRYVEEAVADGRRLTFYNWECPPRFLDVTKRGVTFVNYCTNIESIFLGKKIDRYTELPRVVTRVNEEQSLLVSIRETSVPFRFAKIIADTNAYFITPESLQILGSAKIHSAFDELKNAVVDKTRTYPMPVNTYFFTDLSKEFRKDYVAAYRSALEILSRTPGDLVSESVMNEQRQRTREHVGLTEDNDVETFTRRTIATYAAEGIVFELLSRTSYFSNCVWLNIEEADQRTIEITNCLRKRQGLGPLPMLFP